MRARLGRARSDAALSPYLHLGVVHPRSLLADLGNGPGTERFETELAWREFYSDVLWHSPDLDHLPGGLAHEPWKSDIGHDQGYPERVVNHAAERLDALERYRIAREVQA